MKTTVRFRIVLSAFVLLGCVPLACQTAGDDDEETPAVVSRDTNGSSATRDVSDAGGSTGGSNGDAENEPTPDTTEARDADESDRTDVSDTSKPDSSDTNEEVDTYEPEPQRVEGPSDRQDYRCNEICRRASLECTETCTNDEGEEVAGVATYLTNVSGETYELDENINNCFQEVSYSKTRRVRTSFWCCCQ